MAPRPRVVPRSSRQDGIVDESLCPYRVPGDLLQVSNTLDGFLLPASYFVRGRLLTRKKNKG
jgi:hypothetical protein